MAEKEKETEKDKVEWWSKFKYGKKKEKIVEEQKNLTRKVQVNSYSQAA